MFLAGGKITKEMIAMHSTWWHSHPAERRESDGELGAVHHPGILLPGTDAVSR